VSWIRKTKKIPPMARLAQGELAQTRAVTAHISKKMPPDADFCMKY
jgi:hypothetical protein